MKRLGERGDRSDRDSALPVAGDTPEQT